MKHPLRHKLLLLLVACIVAAFTGEIALRWFLSPREQTNRYLRTHHTFQTDRQFVAFDEHLGYFHRPNLNVAFTNREFHTNVMTNSQGFRDDEQSLDDPDILLLGDSFAFGWGVEKHETAEHHLEKMSGLKVLNMGVSGYGTIQQTLLLSDWLQRTGDRGKIAVFLFYDNDLIDNLGYGFGVYPIIYKFQGKHAITTTTHHNFETWLDTVAQARPNALRRASYLADYTGMQIERLLPQQYSYKIDYTMPHGGEPVELGTAFEIITYTLRQLVEETQTRVLFVYIPKAFHYDDANEPSAFDSVAYTLQARGFPLLDLRPILSRDDYLNIDVHWTGSGHEKAARVIVEHLHEMRWIDTP